MAIETFKKKSSNIAEEGVSYDSEKKELTVPFKSFKNPKEVSRYRYSGIPEKVWEDLKKAESIGSFINKHIVKGDYDFVKL